MRGVRELWWLSWPILIDLLLQTAINNINVLLMAQFSDTAVAAVAAANQVLGLTPFIYGFVSVGTQIIAAQLIGAKKLTDLPTLITTAAYAATGLGVVVGLGIALCAPWVLHGLGLRGAIFTVAVTYLRIVALSVGLSALAGTGLALLRSFGRTRAAIVVPLVTNGITLCGSWLSVHNPLVAQQWGVTGLALAAICGHGIGLIAALGLTHRALPAPLTRKAWQRPSWPQLRLILRLGLPSSGESLSYQGAQTVVLALAASLGATALITKSYINAIGQLLSLSAFALAQGNQIQVGRLVGARAIAAAKHTALVATAISAAVTAAVCGVTLLFSTPILTSYTHDPAVLALAHQVLIAEAALNCVRVVNIVLVDALNAAGDVRTPFYYSLIVLWGVSIPFAYWLALPAGFGLLGIWIAYIIDESIRGVLMLARWRSGKWQTRAVVT